MIVKDDHDDYDDHNDPQEQDCFCLGEFFCSILVRVSTIFWYSRPVFLVQKRYAGEMDLD